MHGRPDEELLVAIVDDEKEEILSRWILPGYRKTDMGILAEHYRQQRSENRWVIFLPVKAAAWLKTVVTPQSCLRTATSDFMSGLLGCSLDQSGDKDFFAEHPLTGKDGVGYSDTLRVVQELVEPYGLYVSRVALAAGYPPSGDLKQWLLILGANPMALTDYTTSNRDFAKLTGLALKDVNEQFRFEFTKKPLFPAIVCGPMPVYKEDKGKQDASNGHASYEGPRGRRHGILHVQLARECPWHEPPVFGTLHKDLEHKLVLDVGKCKLPDGKTVDDAWRLANTKKSYTPTTPTGSTLWDADWDDPVPEKRKSSLREKAKTLIKTTKQLRGYGKKCFLCGTEDKEIVAPHTCRECWGWIWASARCSCGKYLVSLGEGPSYAGIKRKGESAWICGRCDHCGAITDLCANKSEDEEAYLLRRAIDGDQRVSELLVQLLSKGGARDDVGCDLGNDNKGQGELPLTN